MDGLEGFLAALITVGLVGSMIALIVMLLI
jgi:hypothetical protein